jgi:hypothetical protein
MTATVNGIADPLQAVSRNLERPPPDLARYMAPTAGTYNCRDIAKTHRLSVHGYGAAIDFNVRRSDYWQWAKPAASYLKTRKNRISSAIVEVFEHHGFIWGGKWYHYDTMHFEYRPELINSAKKADRARGGRPLDH